MALRFEADGSLDASFGEGGRVWTDLATLSTPLAGRVSEGVAAGVSGASALAVTPDGRFILGGYTGTAATTEAALVRYTADGKVDPSFGSAGVVVTDFGGVGADVVSALALAPGGRIVATGSSGDRLAMARYHPGGGALDASFGPEGIVLSDGMLNGLSAAVDSTGRVLVAGQSGKPGGPFDLAVARFRVDGVPDASFGTGGFARTDLGASGEFPRALLPEADGGVLVAGTSGAGFVLLRHLADGRRDPSFGDRGAVTSGPSIGWARSIERLPDGRLVVAGARLHVIPDRQDAEREVAVCRYLADGTLDPSFGTDGVVGTDVVTSRHDDGVAAGLHPDGRLTITATSFDAENIHPYVVLVRYGDVVT
jgi:uncharacterized delta-60 repeat protein